MKKLVALLLCLMMVVPATLASAETAEGKVLNIWCWNDEFQSRFNAYYPEVKEIAEDKSTTTLNDGTIVKWTINPNEGNNYQNKLDEALRAQESAAADDKIDIFLIEADYALKYVDSPYTLDVKADIGLTDEDLAGQYKYTQEIATSADGKLKAYWFGSGTPTYLIEKMREFHVLPSQLGRVRAKASSFDAATERMTSLTPLLYQSGYLTIKDYEKKIDVYTLDFPNKEIEVGLFDCLLPGYLGSGIDMGRVVIADISSYINSGKMDEALQMLADFLETIPYCDNTNYEGHYQQMFYIIFALLTDYNIIVEQHTAKGRIDITMETADTIYVMELKFNKSAQEALDQINDKHYAQAFALKNKEIVKVGLNFSVKDEVNTLEWVIS